MAITIVARRQEPVVEPVNDFVKLAKEFEAAKNATKEARKLVADCLKKEDEMETSFLLALQSAGLNEVEEGGSRFYILEEVVATLPEECREKFLEWMDANGHSAGRVKRTIHPQTLSSFVKKYVSNNVLGENELLDNGVNIVKKIKIGVQVARR